MQVEEAEVKPDEQEEIEKVLSCVDDDNITYSWMNHRHAHLHFVHVCTVRVLPYLFDQTPLLISRRSRIVSAAATVLEEIVVALEY